MHLMINKQKDIDLKKNTRNDFGFSSLKLNCFNNCSRNWHTDSIHTDLIHMNSIHTDSNPLLEGQNRQVCQSIDFVGFPIFVFWPRLGLKP